MNANGVREDWPHLAGVTAETMRMGISKQAKLIPGVLEHVIPQMKEILSNRALADVKNVFLVGCGDSYYAALATNLAFSKLSGCRTESIEALEFSRYVAEYLPSQSLVVSLSAGGTTSRPVEAIRVARRAGAQTVAITGMPDSLLAREADMIIVQNEQDFRAPAPPDSGTFHIGNYLANLITLYVLAIELCRRTGGLRQEGADELVTEITRASEIISKTIDANRSRIKDYARSVPEVAAHYILGGGPSYATALYMAAKLFEMPQILGVAVELEEWAHEQYFLTRPGTAVTVVAPPGRSIVRAREQILGAKDMGARVVAICDHNDSETMALADVSFGIIGELREEFCPLTYCVPGQLFAVSLCEEMDKPAFQFISPAQNEINIRQIKRSAML